MSRTRSIAELAKVEGRHKLGASLYLNVVGKSACFEYRYKHDKKVHTKSLGSYFARNGTPPVTLALAKQKVAALLLDRKNGQPITVAKTESGRTFGEAVEWYFGNKGSDWTPVQLRRLRAMLKQHAAAMDNVPVTQITREQLADMLKGPGWPKKPFWKGPGSHTANRVRGLIERVLTACDIEPNPASWRRLKPLLPEKVAESEHHAALPFADVPAFMTELAADVRIRAKALAFVILTATRLDETLEATWGEIDLVARVWTIPAARMKMRREHIVPLTDQMIARLGTPTAPDVFIFPSQTGSRLAQETVRELLKKLRPDVTIHGFRSSFDQWAMENRYRREAIDRALAHKIPDKTQAAYDRAKLLQERRELMDAWSNFAVGER